MPPVAVMKGQVSGLSRNLDAMQGIFSRCFAHAKSAPPRAREKAKFSGLGGVGSEENAADEGRTHARMAAHSTIAMPGEIGEAFLYFR